MRAGMSFFLPLDNGRLLRLHAPASLLVTTPSLSILFFAASLSLSLSLSLDNSRLRRASFFAHHRIKTRFPKATPQIIQMLSTSQAYVLYK